MDFKLFAVAPRTTSDWPAFPVRRCAGPRHGAPSGEILAGQALGVAHDIGWGPLGDDMAAVHPGAWPHVDDVVGAADRFLVMFDDDHRVAEVAQVFQRIEKAPVVALGAVRWRARRGRRERP